MPWALMTCAQRSASFSIRRRNSSPLLCAGLMPCVSKAVFTSGSARMPFSSALSRSLKALGVPAGASLLMLRPERLRILNGAAAGPGADSVNVLAGTVQEMVYQGDSYLLQVRLDVGGLVGVRGVSTGEAMAALPKVGAPIRLGLSAEDTILLADEKAV